MATCRDCFHCRACHEMFLVAVAQEDDFFELHDAETCEDFVNKADVDEVKHGEWKRQKNGFYFLCSVCGKAAATKGNYCHSCGAKMDGGEAG